MTNEKQSEFGITSFTNKSWEEYWNSHSMEEYFSNYGSLHWTRNPWATEHRDNLSIDQTELREIYMESFTKEEVDAMGHIEPNTFLLTPKRPD